MYVFFQLFFDGVRNIFIQIWYDNRICFKWILELNMLRLQIIIKGI